VARSDVIVHTTDCLPLVDGKPIIQETDMRKLVIATVLVLLPTAAFAQPATIDNAAANPVPSSGGAYGPPAPTPAPNYSGPPQARSNQPATDGGASTARHKGHRRGAYVEADGGVMRPQ